MAELFDTNRSPRLDNPIDSIEEPTFELFKNLCGQYEFWTPEGRARSRKVIAALLAFYYTDSDTDYYADVYKEMSEMYDDALEDARLGRGNAEIENLHRDALARRQAVEK